MSVFTTIFTYLFDPLPAGPFRFIYAFVALVVLVLAAGITLKIMLKKWKEDKIFKKLFRDLPGKLFIIALLEGIYVLVRYERMAYLSMRFLNFLILAYVVYVGVYYANMYFKEYPAQKKHHEEQLKLNKYLPRKHHKKH
jgi:hypothetical protein